MSDAWDYAVAGEAVDFISARKTTDRWRIVAILEQLAENPSTKPDAYFHDRAGRKISVIWQEGFKICFWVDHFAKEVRITEVAGG